MNPVKILLIASVTLASCTGNHQVKKINLKEKAMTIDSTKQYGFNRDFLREYATIIELKTLIQKLSWYHPGRQE